MYQRYYLGKDSIRNLINEVEYYRPNSVFLVRGKKSYESCDISTRVIVNKSSFKLKKKEINNKETIDK